MCISSDILIFSSPILRRLVSMRQGLTDSPPPPPHLISPGCFLCRIERKWQMQRGTLNALFPNSPFLLRVRKGRYSSYTQLPRPHHIFPHFSSLQFSLAVLTVLTGLARAYGHCCYLVSR